MNMLGAPNYTVNRRPKDKPDGSGHSAPTCMVCFLPNELMAPANQIVQEEASLDIDEAE
jgi:hypothetical protein